MDKAVELHTLEDEVIRERKPHDMKLGTEFDKDKYELAKTGKKQVLKVLDASSPKHRPPL
jgi:choline transport protein